MAKNYIHVNVLGQRIDERVYLFNDGYLYSYDDNEYFISPANGHLYKRAGSKSNREQDRQDKHIEAF